MSLYERARSELACRNVLLSQPGNAAGELATEQMADGRRVGYRGAHLHGAFPTLHCPRQDSLAAAPWVDLSLGAQIRLARRRADALSELEDHAGSWALRLASRWKLLSSLSANPCWCRFLGKQPDLEDFRTLTGNLKLTLIFLALAWILAAFGEEMVYRGYLMNRVADLFNRTPRAWIISLIIVTRRIWAGARPSGLTGVIDEGLMGLLLGLIYLRTGRNLSVPIIAHGVQDSIDFILIFLGKYPGM